MNERHRHLNQALQELALRRRRRPPDILQNLMRFKELGGVEQGDAVQISGARWLVDTGLEHRCRLDAYHD